MASTTVARMTDSGPPVPAMGTFPSAANQLFPKGTIVQRDASGNAVVGADGNGFPAVGVAKATYDNRTGSEAGGLAGDLDVDVDYGVFAFDVDGTPLPGETVWVKDNQTVSDDSDTGARGVAGVCIEIRTLNGVSQCLTWMGPHVAALFSDDSALGTAVTTAQADIDELQADALSASHSIPVSLMSLREATTMNVGNAAANGGLLASDTTPILSAINGATDGCQLVTWASSNNDQVIFQIPLPADLDDTADLVLVTRIASGGTTNAVGFAVKSFFDEGDTAVDDTSETNQTTSFLNKITTIAAADVPAGATTLSVGLTPVSHTTDSMKLTAVYLKYTRKMLT